MLPLRLTAHNVRSYEELDVDFGEGVLALVGPNGAGKSTICDLIDTALFADGARELAPLLRQGKTELDLTLDFEHAGERYTVWRSYNGKKAKLEFGRWGEHSLTPLNRETVVATQIELEQTLGFTRETFRASAFCRQGDARWFCDAQPRERKALLAEILRLDVWDRLLELVRVDQREHDGEIGWLQARAEASQQLIAKRDELATTFANADIAAQHAEIERLIAEEALKSHREELAAASEQYAQRRAVQAEIARLDAEVTRLGETLKAAAQARAAKATIEQGLLKFDPEAAKRHGLETALQNAGTAVHEHEIATRERQGCLAAAEAAATMASSRRERLEGLEAQPIGEARCDRCQQRLGEEARAAALASLRDELEHAEKEEARWRAQAEAIVVPEAPSQEEVETLRAQQVSALAAWKQALTLREQLHHAEEAIARGGAEVDAAFGRVREEWEVKARELAALPEVQRVEGDEGTLIRELDDRRVREHDAIRSLAVARERLNAVAGAERELA